MIVLLPREEQNLVSILFVINPPILPPPSLIDPKHDTILSFDGKKVAVAQGKPIPQHKFSNSSFSQSEYLVYRESQNRLRYLLKMKMY